MDQILIRSTRELKEILKIRSKKMGITMNALILQILWEWLKKESKNE